MLEMDDGAQRARKQYFGKYAGFVVDNEPRPGQSHRGELTVLVPGILEETPDGNGNRPLQVVAAPSFLPGFFFIPEKDAPVWVEFVAGDIDHPIWTGVWYSDDIVPRTADDAGPTRHQKVIRTAKGHVVELDDTPGAESVVLVDGAHGHTVTLDAAGIKIALGPSGGGLGIEIGRAGITLTDATGTPHGAVLSPLLKWLATHVHGGPGSTPDPASLAKLQDPALLSKPGP